MEEIVEILTRIEQEANGILERATAYKKTLAEEFEQNIANAELEVRAEMNQKLNDLLQTYQDEITGHKDKLGRHVSKQLDKMDRKEKHELDDMADAIFEQIIKE